MLNSFVRRESACKRLARKEIGEATAPSPHHYGRISIRIMSNAKIKDYFWRACMRSKIGKRASWLGHKLNVPALLWQVKTHYQ